MKSLEIPLVKERDWIYRSFEILPGFLSWGLLALPVILSFISPTVAAYFVIAYLLIWFVKAIALNVRMVQGYKQLNQHMSYEWQKLLEEIDNPSAAFAQYTQGINPKWHQANLLAAEKRKNTRFKKDNIVHAIVIAVYNESRDVLEPTIQSILRTDYDNKKFIVVFAYEERGGTEVEQTVLDLTEQYGHEFRHMMAVKHPKDIPGEVIGKGGNITFAGRELLKYVDEQKLEHANVLVTTLDSDNRPHPQYFAALTYAYLACPDPIRTSYQPITMFTNNIWDAPAPMRVIASGNSFWNIVLTLRPHMIRNFASHSQSLAALVDTDFWSVRTIVEDGHQYWRSYFTYKGKYDVVAIKVPIYQDAVLARTYTKTLKAQFVQLRRWAWGCTDIAYVLHTGWRNRSKAPKADLFFKTMRLIESHVSWATAPLLLLLAAFVPLYLAPDASDSVVANQLPIIASYIQRIAMVGIFVSIFFSIKLLPPKPPHYKKRHRVYMFLQWLYLPITTIVYNGIAALYSQTRLMIGWYYGKFDVTEKAVKKDAKTTTV
jgi:hypothetical protein